MSFNKLFPTGNVVKKWVKFKSDGYENDVTGIIYRAGEAVCGLPLGGIATGAVDLDTDGTLGRCTCFNSVIPPRELGGVPFLALGVDRDVWVLATKNVKGVKHAKEIYYWGHYPVADLQYDTDAPVKVALRAWSPFIPGNAEVSNTPAMIFEVMLHNPGEKSQKGTIALTFPGPSHEEVGTGEIVREESETDLIKTINVHTGNDTGYTVAVLNDRVRFGGDITPGSGSFADILNSLPPVDRKTTGTSAAVDFELKRGQGKIVRFIVSWFYPVLNISPHAYIHAYGARYENALDVAAMIAIEHESLLARIIAWQDVIYGEEKFPDWLRDSLVNTLYLMAEDSFWESNSSPPEEWAEETGMFSMVESTRTSPGQSCIPSDFYGNFPVVYFFPQLSLSTLRGFASYQRPNGEIPIYWGQDYERQNPYYQLLHVTSSCNYVDIVDRLWLRSGDDGVVHEFFPSVRSAIEYLQSLDADGDGLIDCRPGLNSAHQFYGTWYWKGAAVHVEGMWLSALLMARRMAEKVGDYRFAKNCQVWWNLGQQSMERKLWNGKYYDVYHDTISKEKSDTILSNQLCGQWCSKLHGVEDVFPEDHVNKALNIIREKCIPVAKWGVAGAIRPDGKIDRSGGETSEGTFTPESLILAMTLLYAGDYNTGIKIAYETMYNLIMELGLQWDMPNTVKPETGEWIRGHDFDQMMIVWALPAAIEGKTLSDLCAKGSLVDRIIKAGTVPRSK